MKLSSSALNFGHMRPKHQHHDLFSKANNAIAIAIAVAVAIAIAFGLTLAVALAHLHNILHNICLATITNLECPRRAQSVFRNKLNDDVCCDALRCLLCCLRDVRAVHIVDIGGAYVGASNPPTPPV